MAKQKEDKTKADMPDTAANEPGSADMAKLTPEQQRIAGYVGTSKADAPRVEAVRDLSTRIEMEVPKAVIKGSEYVYAWLSVADLGVSLSTGTKWELVTRHNHSHAPERFFGLDGAITYKGQNILAFCFRDIQEAEEAAIVAEYNKKTDRITEPTDRIKEGEVSRLGDSKAAGKAIQQDTLNPDESYDFEEPL